MTTGPTTGVAEIEAASHRRPPRPTVDQRARRPRRRRWTVHAMVLTVCALLLGSGVFWGGFVVFASTVSALKPAPPPEADGIVVFTGGAERVSGAIDLLSDGHARRLLISGVHPETSAEQIGRVVDAGPTLFDCCVDLDRRAANTVGNAAETAKWVRSNAFSSLIVVTSAYHMPRSLTELGSAMPEVRLMPYAVSPTALDLDRWYLSANTTALLLQEYLKYTAARARLLVGGPAPADRILADLTPHS